MYKKRHYANGRRFPFYIGVSIDLEKLSFDDNLKQWLPKNLKGRTCWSGIEEGICSVKAFRRYLKKNKHNFPPYTKITLESKYIDCQVIGYIKRK